MKDLIKDLRRIAKNNQSQFIAETVKQAANAIDKKEAEKLNAMTPDELVRYWERREGE